MACRPAGRALRLWQYSRSSFSRLRSSPKPSESVRVRGWLRVKGGCGDGREAGVMNNVEGGGVGGGGGCGGGRDHGASYQGEPL